MLLVQLKSAHVLVAEADVAVRDEDCPTHSKTHIRGVGAKQPIVKLIKSYILMFK